MNYGNYKTGFNKESKFTAEHYGTKVSVEYDHSDLNFDEVMDAFETLVQGMGWHKDAWKDWIIERAEQYKEEEAEELEEREKVTYEDWKKQEEEAVRSIIASKMDAKVFADNLNNPPSPNDNLKIAAEEFLKKVKQ